MCVPHLVRWASVTHILTQTLYADSPIDSSLFGGYIHQNYTQFCDDIEHCDGVSEWLSWVDSNGGEVVRPFYLHRSSHKLIASDSGIRPIRTAFICWRWEPFTRYRHQSRGVRKSFSSPSGLRLSRGKKRHGIRSPT